MESTKGMNIYAKMVEARKAVPAIVKQKHSDGVKYKFAKIDAIYELLTPALNTLGISFEIISETTARKDALGNPEFWYSYTQDTRNGPRTVYVYEADLQVLWVNAEDPADSIGAKLHALGTNDGGPDKAKGSAWTYCLKYYLFEKLGIDQGEDDPDNTDRTAGMEPPIAPKAERPEGISDAQIKRLFALAKAAGIDNIEDRVKAKNNIASLKQLTREKYDQICAGLEAQKNNKEEEGNAQ